MMKAFMTHYRLLLADRRQDTLKVTGGLLAAILITWILLDVMLWIGFFGLIIAAPLILWSATLLPQFSWFWGPLSWQARKAATPPPAPVQAEQAEAVTTAAAVPPEEAPDTEEEADPVSVLPSLSPAAYLTDVAEGCAPIRLTPVGTRVLTLRRDEAVLEVKSAIRFWSWLGPTLCIIGAIFGAPIGAFLGALAYEAHPQSWQQNFGAYVATGSILATGGFILATIWSYFATRPWVRIIIEPGRIKYGDQWFDRRFLHGVGLGYSTEEVELQSRFLDPNFGVTMITMRYGRWGEDLRYMVNSRYAPQIVIWINEIMDHVGERAPAPRFEPMMGRKIELL